MTQHKGVSGGRLNVAAISAGDYFLPRLLVEFIGRHQGVTLNFTVHNREGLLAHLAANLDRPRDHGAAARRTPTWSASRSRRIPYVIVAAPSHPLAGKARIDDEASRARALRRAREGLGHLAKHAGGVRPASRPAASRARDHQHRDAQAGGDGRARASASCRRTRSPQELRTKSLVVLDVRGFPRMQRWYVVHRRHKRLPPVAQAFRSSCATRARASSRASWPAAQAHRQAAERAVALGQGRAACSVGDFDRRRQRPQQQPAGRDLQLELAGLARPARTTPSRTRRRRSRASGSRRPSATRSTSAGVPIA